jgi:hypothetical protein
MRAIVCVKRVVDYAVKVRVQKDNKGVDIASVSDFFIIVYQVTELECESSSDFQSRQKNMSIQIPKNEISPGQNVHEPVL